MPPNSGVRRSNNNNLKTLRANFRQSVTTLHELFPEWTQDDLSFVMDECQGDMELAITRITEGHANQWGQVKSKKPKPQPHIKKTSNDGDGRGNNYTKNKTNNKNKKPKKFKERQKDKEHTKQIVPLPEEEKKPSWASILKGPAKPEETQVKNEIDPTPETPTVVKIEEDQVLEKSKVDLDEEVTKEKTIGQEIPDSPKEQEEEQEIPDSPKEQEKEQEKEQSPKVEKVVIEEVMEAKVDTIQKEELKESKEEDESVQINDAVQTTVVRKSTVRRLNQTEAVVLPGNQQSNNLTTISVQFGSLTLNNGEEQVVKDENEAAVEETVIVDRIEIQPEENIKITIIEPKLITPEISHKEVQAQPVQFQPPVDYQPSVQPNPIQHTLSQPLPPQPIPNPIIAQAPSYIQPYPNYPQQPYIQQNNERYTVNNYGNYLPHGMNNYNVVTPADYMVYNTPEHQRMGYYDPTLYVQSPSLNTAIPRERYTTTPMDMMMNNSYNGYYPYYYLQQAPPQPYTNYSQPQQTGSYVNKSVYHSNNTNFKNYNTYNDNMIQPSKTNFDNKPYYNPTHPSLTQPQVQSQSQVQPIQSQVQPQQPQSQQSQVQPQPQVHQPQHHYQQQIPLYWHQA